MELNLQKAIAELLAAEGKNRFDEPYGPPMFDTPLIAVASAQDSWFVRFKEIIGPFYWNPQQALALAAPGAVARSVICWCLPINAVARLANRQEKETPARTWAYVRTFGEELNSHIRRGMEELLRSSGYAAIAPAIAPENVFGEQPGVGITSLWSERHTAFVAGLGTFGLSGGLITERGIAHRLGSVVTDAELTPTPRPYGDDPFAWCLKTATGKCGACIRRCPTGSIGETTAARDKGACMNHYANTVKERCQPVFQWEGIYGCGLCQTGVPCEERNPVAKLQID